MAAGDLVVVDWQIEIRATLIAGSGSVYDVGDPGIGGLGMPALKSGDVELEQSDGKYLGRDLYANRIVTIPLVWGGGPAAVMNGLSALTDPTSGAWRKVDDASLLPLFFRLPGWGRFSISGRPRGMVEDLSKMPKGEGAALLTFETATPAIAFG